MLHSSEYLTKNGIQETLSRKELDLPLDCVNSYLSLLSVQNFLFFVSFCSSLKLFVLSFVGFFALKSFTS